MIALKLQYFAEDIQPTAGEKTFTQEDVNRIISKRILEEKAKIETDIAKREKQLEQREFQLQAKQMLKNNHLPEVLLEVLKGDDVETFSKSIDTLKSYIEKEYKIEHHIEGAPSGVGKTGLTVDRVRRAMGL